MNGARESKFSEKKCAEKGKKGDVINFSHFQPPNNERTHYTCSVIFNTRIRPSRSLSPFRHSLSIKSYVAAKSSQIFRLVGPRRTPDDGV